MRFKSPLQQLAAKKKRKKRNEMLTREAKTKQNVGIYLPF